MRLFRMSGLRRRVGLFLLAGRRPGEVQGTTPTPDSVQSNPSSLLASTYLSGSPAAWVLWRDDVCAMHSSVQGTRYGHSGPRISTQLGSYGR